MSDAEVYKAAGIGRFSSMRSRDYPSGKASAAALSLADVVDAKQLLALASFSLLRSDAALVIRFCPERGIRDLMQVHEALDYPGQNDWGFTIKTPCKERK